MGFIDFKTEVNADRYLLLIAMIHRLRKLHFTDPCWVDNQILIGHFGDDIIPWLHRSAALLSGNQNVHPGCSAERNMTIHNVICSVLLT